MDIVEVMLPGVLVAVLSYSLVFLLKSSGSKKVEEDSAGSIRLSYSPGLHVYGGLMVLMLSFGCASVILPFWLDMEGAGSLFVFMGVAIIFMALWGIYAGYGGRVSYSDDGVTYIGIRRTTQYTWDDIESLQDGIWAQYMKTKDTKLVLSKTLTGYQQFSAECAKRGVHIPSTKV
ncbi:hypothetical protein PUV54_13185 [Hyphococcus flavus]|uniref:Uncharacterized protein n=1 Tax=Hyphococcus flavus TaxID=1866326 RepID=A0AAE9ZDF7_9PROT|nr:hypothetical protein [Hyphococcus flavus]WDI30907.1 hypothetical protein PUV54_13185 [Hyphococcus flavus]